MYLNKAVIKKSSRDFPGGPVVKSPPYNAGDAGSIPGQGTKIPHAAGQLSPRATTTELVPQLENACAANYRAHTLWNLRATTTEPTCPGACSPQLEKRNPHATTREKPVHHNERSRMSQRRSLVPQLRPDAAKNK